MDIASILAQSGALDSAAQELGISPQIAAAGASVLLPAILGGFKSQAQAHPQGLDGLGGLLQQLGGGDLLSAVVGTQPTPVEQGNGVLGTIFGSKDVSRAVAASASEQSGISADVLKKLLPIVAMLVAGYLATHSGGGTPAAAPAAPAAPAGGGVLGGGLGGILGQVLGSVLGGGAPAPAPAPVAPAAPAGGLGGLANILDLNGDGNPLDDIIGMAGRLRQ